MSSGAVGSCAPHPTCLPGGDTFPCSYSLPQSCTPCSAGAQGEFSSPLLRLHYCSLRTPDQTIDYNMETGKRCDQGGPQPGGWAEWELSRERCTCR